jgi:hypothetical protein
MSSFFPAALNAAFSCSSRSSAALAPSFLMPKSSRDQQVDACRLLDEVATSAGHFGLGEIRREVKRAADERASAGANRADSEGRDRRQRARHSATRAARRRAARRGRPTRVPAP